MTTTTIMIDRHPAHHDHELVDLDQQARALTSRPPTGFGAGASHDSRELQTCTFQAPSASNTTKIHEGTPKRGRKKENCGGRGKKKSAKFWAPTLRGDPPFGPPPFGPHPSKPHPSGVWPEQVSWPEADWLEVGRRVKGGLRKGGFEGWLKGREGERGVRGFAHSGLSPPFAKGHGADLMSWQLV